MAREVDLDNLQIADLHYLAQRSWLITEAESVGYENIRDLVKNRDNITQADLVLEDEIEDEEEEEIDYVDLKVEELKAELEKRELPTDGKKPDLILRLETDDANRAEEEEEEEEN